MEANGRSPSGQLVPIASASPSNPSGSAAGSWTSNKTPSTMPYTCQNCAKRKIKCDKIAPICSSCRKGRLDCFYQAPPPRRRKRKLSDDINEKVARYERILSENGLLPDDGDASPGRREPERTTSIMQGTDFKTPGTLLSKQGKSRYYDSNFWRHIRPDDIEPDSDEEDEENERGFDAQGGDYFSDPLTAAFLGSQQQNLRPYHPTYQEAMTMWKAYVDNVEPLQKILHVPSTLERLQVIAQQPDIATKADESLMFAIYHFAIISLPEDDCERTFGQSKDALTQRYRVACRQALVNASFLKTSELPVLQAFTLYLIACKRYYDPHTLFVLTGAMMRIAQRMGIHRDGKGLGLPPFEAEIRRRTFYVCVPLEGTASQMAGSEMAILPDSADVDKPMNINDDQLWPGMTELPKEQSGATDMIYCLTRATLGRAYVGLSTAASLQTVAAHIDAVEREVEEKYIRYCDILNPLHFLTVSFARAAICAMRMRSQLSQLKGSIIPTETIQELIPLALRILDTDAAAHETVNLKNFFWHIGSFFVWGSFDSIVFILTTLRRPDVLSRKQIDDAWDRMIRAYKHHDELLETKRAVQVAIGRLTLRAWKSNPPTNNLPEPAFIAALRTVRKVNPDAPVMDRSSSGTLSSLGPSPSSDANALFGTFSDGTNLNLDTDFNLDTADWMFWEQVIKDYQMQGGGQQ
ncbi:mitogen-activated protein kinase [Neohortaea acidophila]|uniref:Mitogen-activated protein kinase n=1 Tax=Neohortaea acidophila TaxID=245834 RepID=A0A6A6PHV0_9PEZI|nr:mitogen-activated protein kinase [Neohortaea acidophila]KAF2478847.1 mitogen-activated protein kinase [Neohortaea acidophila]